MSTRKLATNRAAGENGLTVCAIVAGIALGIGLRQRKTKFTSRELRNGAQLSR